MHKISTNTYIQVDLKCGIKKYYLKEKGNIH